MTLQLWKQLEKKQFSPVYLLLGTETYLIKETIQKLVENGLSEEETEFNISHFDMEETPLQFALEEAETFPFMGERKLIIIHNPIFLTAEKPKEKVDHNVQALLDYLENPSPFSIVIFDAPYEKLDERKKVTKQLKRTATLLEAKKLKDQELMSWVADQAALYGVEFDQDALPQFIATAGENLMLLANEVQKLALYVHDEKVITSRTVEELASKSLEQNILNLVDYIMNRKTVQAIELLRSLIRQKEEPIKILALMASQIRLIYVSKELSRQGYGQQKIAGTLKVHPFRVKLALQKASSFRLGELLNVLDAIAEADYRMKTGQMDKVLLLEMIILQIGNRQEAQVNKKSL
ncbi:MAG: DNA polymerase III subunit delta [Bacillus sp. (in: firmicutes)]